MTRAVLPILLDAIGVPGQQTVTLSAEDARQLATALAQVRSYAVGLVDNHRSNPMPNDFTLLMEAIGNHVLTLIGEADGDLTVLEEDDPHGSRA